jgi:chitinase
LQTCNPTNNSVFPGTALADCSFLADDIKSCQANNKSVSISLGGATGVEGLTSDDQAQNFADQIWDMFLGGSGNMRPFGDAVLDG